MSPLTQRKKLKKKNESRHTFITSHLSPHGRGGGSLVGRGPDLVGQRPSAEERVPEVAVALREVVL